MDAVAPACRRKAPSPVDGGGVDGGILTLVGLPGHELAGPHRSLGSLVDPELEKAKFAGCQVLGPNLVLGRGHDRLVGMGGELKQKTLLGIAGFHVGSTLVPLANVVGGFHDHFPLGAGTVVAGQTIGPKEGKNFLLKVDRLVPLDFIDLELGSRGDAEEGQ